MTYAASTVAYWVGQANDQSTGTHPTGWTNGQRWSETATEWQAMYDGVSASLAAMTTDRNTWQGRANNAWGPTRVWNSGSSYETLYNDMSSQKSTWESRANQAWGPNRVWNNGSSWEALYNDMVVQRDAWITNYNNMTANRDYWQGQANYYWGPSRVHGSGSTWENLYSGLLGSLNNPDGHIQAIVNTSWSTENSTTPVTTLTIPKAGHWAFGAYAEMTANLNSHGSIMRIAVSGILNEMKQGNGQNNTNQMKFGAGFYGHAACSAGQQLNLYASNDWIISGTLTGLIYAHFVPSSSNPT
jgi:hypothetical protein